MNEPQPRARVLVVDDEPDLIRILQFGLQAIGFQIETASDGQEALKKAREQKPDIILLDLMLPKLDGYKVCRLLKFDERYKNIPIIILSARTQEGDQLGVLDVGLSPDGKQAGVTLVYPTPEFGAAAFLRTTPTTAGGKPTEVGSAGITPPPWLGPGVYVPDTAAP